MLGDESPLVMANGDWWRREDETQLTERENSIAGEAGSSPDAASTDGPAAGVAPTAGIPSAPGTDPEGPAAPDKSQQLRDMELIISRLLRIGVTVSSAVILVGLVMMVVTRSTGYGAVSTYHLKQILQYHPHREGDFPTTVSAVAAGAVALKPFAIIMAGALLLIATPVLRVAVSLVTFALEGDRSFVPITLYVLVVLLVSFLIGRSLG